MSALPTPSAPSASSTPPSARIRTLAAVAGVVTALVVTGCGSGDDGDGGKDADAKPSASAPSSAEPSASASGGSTGGEQSGVEGQWLTTEDGDAIALVITGDKAALFGSKGTVCSGSVTSGGAMQMIKLKCTDKSTDRASGMVESADATTLKVKWDGLGEETYQKSAGGQLPSGLPTAGLGQ